MSAGRVSLDRIRILRPVAPPPRQRAGMAVELASRLLDAAARLRCACGLLYDGRGVVVMPADEIEGWRCSECEREQARRQS